jgi:hypothetical protein
MMRLLFMRSGPSTSLWDRAQRFCDFKILQRTFFVGSLVHFSAAINRALDLPLFPVH